jgi:hypothetical protein
MILRCIAVHPIFFFYFWLNSGFPKRLRILGGVTTQTYVYLYTLYFRDTLDIRGDVAPMPRISKSPT